MSQKSEIAIARMLLIAIYKMLKKTEPNNVELYRLSDKPPVQREATVEQADFSPATSRLPGDCFLHLIVRIILFLASLRRPVYLLLFSVSRYLDTATLKLLYLRIGRTSSQSMGRLL